MDPSKTEIILGPPGTGKTTTLLRIMEELLNKGYHPTEIAFLGFTRKAADEAKTRAIKAFNYTSDDLPYFRTIHSFAYRQLGMRTDSVLRLKHLKELGDKLGIEVSGFVETEEGTVYGMRYGDRLFFIENMARIRMMPLRQLWETMYDEDIDWWELERAAKALYNFKESRGLYDYTDMLVDYLKRGVVPKLRIVIVDEAQDLSPLQWELVEKLAGEASVDRVYVAGDDDQAIYRWAGADVDRFIQLPGRATTLDVSYRVPSAVRNCATRIVGKIGLRRKKVWKPARVGGDLVYTSRLEEANIADGSWLLIARNGYLLSQLEQYCMRAGVYYSSVNGSPVTPGNLEAIQTWEKLRKGQQVTAAKISRVYDLISTGGSLAHGAKAKLSRAEPDMLLSLNDLHSGFGLLRADIWHEALDRLPLKSREFMVAALRAGEKLTATPRVHINTIHGVKGGEADNVLLVSDMADRTLREMDARPDDEHRVWYVATTRARDKLVILQPQTNRYYDL